MGKLYIVNFADGTHRVLASFSTNRAKLFYDVAKLLEGYVGQECGIQDDLGMDEHEVDGEKFVSFFQRFWQLGWLADNDRSFVGGWAPWAAGIVESITLQPVSWVDRRGNTLQVRRYMLSDELEQELQRKKEAGAGVVRSSSNNTDITI